MAHRCLSRHRRTTTPLFVLTTSDLTTHYLSMRVSAHEPSLSAIYKLIL
jgi:hypothetical protein